jgi:hypothetical protein
VTSPSPKENPAGSESQITQNGNPKSPENEGNDADFLQKRLLPKPEKLAAINHL